MAMPNSREFYVYQLVDPRCGSVFYVGKGVGSRMARHEKDAIAGCEGEKADRIREILSCGMRPVSRIVARFRSEVAAYDAERAMIAEIGLSNLTNVAPGGGGVRMHDAASMARQSVRDSLTNIRRAVMAKASGVSITYDGVDLLAVAIDTIRHLRETSGPEWFDKTVWGR